MSRDLVNAALAEEQRLLRELEATPLFRRLEAVRAVLRAYQEPGNLLHHTSARAPNTPDSARPASLTAHVIDLAQAYLRQSQRRAQSVEILRVVRDCGIEVHGRKPSTIIASILSHSDLFDNVRGQGYGLTEWLSGQAGQPADTVDRASQHEAHEPDGDVDPEVELDDSGFPQTGDLESKSNSATDSNGATTGQGSWPQLGS